MKASEDPHATAESQVGDLALMFLLLQKQAGTFPENYTIRSKKITSC